MWAVVGNGPSLPPAASLKSGLCPRGSAGCGAEIGTAPSHGRVLQLPAVLGAAAEPTPRTARGGVVRRCPREGLSEHQQCSGLLRLSLA